MNYVCFFNYLFQSADEEIVNEMNPIERTDIKVEPEEFCRTNDEEIVNEMNPIEKTDVKVKSEEFSNANDAQRNYDGVTWMIIFMELLHIFYCYSVCICFDILSNIHHLIRL